MTMIPRSRQFVVTHESGLSNARLFKIPGLTVLDDSRDAALVAYSGRKPLARVLGRGWQVLGGPEEPALAKSPETTGSVSSRNARELADLCSLILAHSGKKAVVCAVTALRQKRTFDRVLRFVKKGGTAVITVRGKPEAVLLNPQAAARLLKTPTEVV